MPRQGNGTYQQPANTAAIPSTPIGSGAYNTLITDLGNEITNSLDRGGRSAMTAALPMGGQKITGMADPTVAADGATKNYVDTTTAAFFSTGDVKLTLKNVADPGWAIFNNGTIGSAASGASSRANADTQALFTLLFNNTTDTWVPILTSGGGATTRAAQVSASAAWAANCRIFLPQTLGRTLAIAGANGGPNGVYALAETWGSETASLVTANLPPYTPAGTIGNVSVSSTSSNVATYNGNIGLAAGGNSTPSVAFSGSTITSTGSGPIFTGTAQGGTSAAFQIMQPTTFLNAMVKL